MSLGANHSNNHSNTRRHRHLHRDTFRLSSLIRRPRRLFRQRHRL
jgi:hypothetical protein